MLLTSLGVHDTCAFLSVLVGVSGSSLSQSLLSDVTGVDDDS